MLRKIRFIFLLFFFSFILFTPFVRAEDFSVTARVPPTTEDVILDITHTPTDTIHEDTYVTVTIQYRSVADANWPVTIQAAWYPGVIHNTATTVEVWDYDVGSATQTDDNIDPTIDLLNNAITWTIPSLTPSSTSHTVTFRLKSKALLLTSQQIDAPIRVSGTIGTSDLDSQETVVFIQKTAAPTQTPTITATPGQSPSTTQTPTASITPPYDISPTQTPSVFAITHISQPILESNRTIIRFTTNESSTYKVDYGKAPLQLNSHINSLQLRKDHEIELSDLEEQTRYYYRITATSQNGTTVTSDLFVFTTSSASSQVRMVNDSIHITSSSLLLLRVDSEQKMQELIVPPEQELTIQLKVENPKTIKRIGAKIQRSDILGLFSGSSSETYLSTETELVELLPHVFSGQLKTPEYLGNYEIVLSIQDISGGFTTMVLNDKIHVRSPIQIIDENGQPVEKALVKIYLIKGGKIAPIPLQHQFSLPLYTDRYGKLSVALPVGTYQADVSAAGYESKVKQFNVSEETGYPTIQLKTQNDFVGLIQYYSSNLNDLFSINKTHLANALPSQRSFNTTLLIFYLALVASALTVLARKHGLSLMEFCYFALESKLYTMDLFFHLTKPVVFIRIFRKKSVQGLSGVTLNLTNAKNMTLYYTKTNLWGEAKIPVEYLEKNTLPLALILSKDGYKQRVLEMNERKEDVEISLEKIETPPNIRSYIAASLDYFFVFLFYAISFIGLLITVGSVYYNGWIVSWPYILISILMVFIWIYYLKYTLFYPPQRSDTIISGK